MESTPDYEGPPAPNTDAWWKELYHECLPSLKFICLQKVRQKETAEEIASESFVRLWQTVKDHPGKFSGKLTMKQYLYRIAINACTDHWRKSKNNIEHASDFAEHDIADEEELVMLFDQQDMLTYVKALIAELPPKLQEVIRLSFIEGKSNEEIAQCLNTQVKVVEVYKTRGLKKLRKLAKGKEQTMAPGAALFILFWISTTA